MKIGIFGFGVMGKNHYRELTTTLAPRFDLEVAICDPRVDGWVDHPPTRMKLPELVDWADAFIIATPTDTHLEILRKVLPKMAPVLVEKPFAFWAKDVPVLRKGYPHLMVGYVERFNPIVSRLRRLVRDGVLGRVLMLETVRVNNVHQASWRDGGIVRDLGVHDFDLVQQLLPAQSDFEFDYADLVYQENKDTHAWIAYRFGEVRCTTKLSWIELDKNRTLTVYGTRATAFVDLVNQNINLEFRADVEPQLIQTYGSPLERELTEFIAPSHKEPAAVDWAGHLSQSFAETVLQQGVVKEWPTT